MKNTISKIFLLTTLAIFSVTFVACKPSSEKTGDAAVLEPARDQTAAPVAFAPGDPKNIEAGKIIYKILHIE